MNIHGWFNAVEAGVWITMGCFLGFRSLYFRIDFRRVALVAAIALIVFGGTDIIEIFTGAWFRPPALLVLNAVCIVALLWCCLRYRAIRKRLRGKETPSPGG